MATRRVEDVLERLSALRDAPELQAVPALRKSLADRVNVVVAKAAQIASERQIRELVPDLLIAFDRLFEDAAERDPQCWGKNAIAKALRDLEYRESEPFCRGFHHIQMEPVWGKHEDTAQTLRGICLLAMVACADVPRGELLQSLVEALTAPEAAVRVEAVRGLAGPRIHRLRLPPLPGPVVGSGQEFPLYGHRRNPFLPRALPFFPEMGRTLVQKQYRSSPGPCGSTASADPARGIRRPAGRHPDRPCLVRPQGDDRPAELRR